MKKFCKSCEYECDLKISNEKSHCNICNNDYCSKQCFIKGEKNNYYYSTYELPNENVNLYFTCCNTQICGSCLSYEIDVISSRNILCDKCNCYFHSDDSCVHPLSVDNDNCTCKLCMDLNNMIKYKICPKCHEDNNQQMFFYDDIKTISKFGNILSAYEFVGCEMSHPSECIIYNLKKHTSIIQSRIEPKFIKCKKMEFFRNLYESTSSEDQEHFIKTRSINCDCGICNKIINVLPDENVLIKAILIECNCEICNKINCKTTLLANIVGNEYIMDNTNYWDCGHDFAPILALNMLAKNESNNCSCSVCKFYSEYK